MRTITRLLLVLCALGFSACGDKDAGPVGTWMLDGQAFWDANRTMFLAEGKDGFDQAATAMKQVDAMPPEQREMARKMMVEQAPPELRPVLEAYLRSPAEATAMVEKQAREMINRIEATLEVRADNTYSGSFKMGANVEQGSGTWSLAGDQFTMTAKTKDGKPAEGDDAKSWTLTLKADTLSGKPEANGPTMVLKRK